MSVQSSNVSYDKRATHEGFIRGELYLIDGSVLSFREFVDVEGSEENIVASPAPTLVMVVEEIEGTIEIP